MDWTELKRRVACSDTPHFFAPSTMRFFRSRTIAHPITATDGSVFFVTSERCWLSCPKPKYTVRRFVNERVHTAGPFGCYATRQKAIAAAKLLAAHPPDCS